MPHSLCTPVSCSVCGVYLHVSDLTPKCWQVGASVKDTVAVAPLPMGGGGALRRSAGPLLVGTGCAGALASAAHASSSLPHRVFVWVLHAPPMSSEPEWSLGAGGGSFPGSWRAWPGSPGVAVPAATDSAWTLLSFVESRGPSPLCKSSHHNSCL